MLLPGHFGGREGHMRSVVDTDELCLGGHAVLAPHEGIKLIIVVQFCVFHSEFFRFGGIDPAVEFHGGQIFDELIVLAVGGRNLRKQRADVCCGLLVAASAGEHGCGAAVIRCPTPCGSSVGMFMGRIHPDGVEFDILRKRVSVACFQNVAGGLGIHPPGTERLAFGRFKGTFRRGERGRIHKHCSVFVVRFAIQGDVRFDQDTELYGLRKAAEGKVISVVFHIVVNGVLTRRSGLDFFPERLGRRKIGAVDRMIGGFFF